MARLAVESYIMECFGVEIPGFNLRAESILGLLELVKTSVPDEKVKQMMFGEKARFAEIHVESSGEHVASLTEKRTFVPVDCCSLSS